RPPAHAQNADASNQSTNVTGWSSGAGQCGGVPAPASATKAAYCAFVTGVRASSNACNSTTSCSSPSRPIGYSPAGTSTHSQPAAGPTATTRKPTYVSRAAERRGSRAETRSSRAPLRNEPPRTASPLVHSQTFPAMSSTPNGDAPSGNEPTVTGP